ncbi:DUF2971 domain-containing protein [Marinifilum fragile]|uniref:DUF2971 domain-containing protein n=1 Tax=Marinifilum fragile TaxID=570161 RepID=UPI002AA93E13|nr:DUF2971 domain-containing protein [Marinifilum fragile]
MHSEQDTFINNHIMPIQITVDKELQEKLSKEINFYGGPYYKFIDLEGAKACLKNSNIQFSTPDTLNDPLECCVDLLKMRNSEEFKKEFYKNEVKTTRDPFRKKKLLKNRSNFLKRYDVNEEFNRILLSRIRQIGICSFARHYTEDTDYLLWSHYAENHKGICIEYDFEFDPVYFARNKFKPILVNYKTKLDSYEFDISDDGIDIIPWSVQKIKKIWSYEDEVRLIHYNLETNCDGKYRPVINKEFITKIIFGCQCEKSNMNEIVRILQDKEYDLSKIKFEKMQLNSEQKLVPKEISLLPYESFHVVR